MARMYLVHDAGFLTSTINSTFLLLAVIACGYAYLPIRSASLEAYEWVKLQLLQTAHKMAWWGILGLLSSSCCVIQILLNALSLGCSGINTVLGPIRPHFMAVTFLSAGASLWVASNNPFQWPATMAGCSLSLFLTFTPELLFWVTRNRAQPERGAEGVKVKTKSVLEMNLKPGAMGCISCVHTVCGVVDKHEDVVSSSVDFESAKIAVQLRQEPGTKADSVALSIEQSLAGSNFPVASWSVQPASASSSINPPNHKPSPAKVSAWLGTRQGVFEAVLAGLLGSSCCLVQLVLNLLTTLNVLHGIGCTGFNKTLGPLRPQLRALTAAYMAWSWYLAHTRGWSKRSLILRTVVFAAVTFLPELLVLAGGPPLAPPSSEVEVVTFKVDGMGCEACQAHVKGVIDRFDGVVASSVDFLSGVAEVHVARTWGREAGAGGHVFAVDAVASKLDEDGYFVDPADALVVPPAAASAGANAEL